MLGRYSDQGQLQGLGYQSARITAPNLTSRAARYHEAVDSEHSVEFRPVRPWQKHCSARCCQRAYVQRRAETPVGYYGA